MTSVSVTDLKTNPSSVLASAEDYPVAVLKRNKTAGYVVGMAMFEKLVEFVEDYVDRKAIEEVDYSKGRDFEEIAEELGI
ncbi:MAG: type II toxin-antitoxin system prevent-host-death family antitoxin [Patescibacteria group bacterium]